MSATSLKLVFGGAAIVSGREFGNEEKAKQLYDLLEKNGVKELDSAYAYWDSEEWIGKTGGSERFAVASKTPGGLTPGKSTSSGILEHIRESLKKLQTEKVDIYYIHAPDPTIELEDMLKGIDDAYKAGYFDRFGLSNFTPENVEQVYSICKEKGYPLPKVYQGSYSPVGRKPEKELLPLLRKLDIAYYVYSPLAGGFLTKTKEQILEGKNAGRFNYDGIMSKLYHGLFNRPAYLDSLELWDKAAKAAGCSRAELGYRWVAYDAPLDAKRGDAIIFGAMNLTQINETLGWLKKGSVGEEAKATIDKIWQSVEHEAQLDNFNK